MTVEAVVKVHLKSNGMGLNGQLTFNRALSFQKQPVSIFRMHWSCLKLGRLLAGTTSEQPLHWLWVMIVQVIGPGYKCCQKKERERKREIGDPPRPNGVSRDGCEWRNFGSRWP